LSDNLGTSMSLNALPAELQQVVYDFDGRYKAAMARCFRIIRERRSTLRDDKMTSLHDGCYVDKYPAYYAEVLLRAKRYQCQMENGIRMVNKNPSRGRYAFRDVIGIYEFGLVQHFTVIQGKAYKSCSWADGVTIGTWLSPTSTVTTIVRCIDVLDPVFQKSVNDVKEWRELGVSENGIPAKDYIRQAFGKDVSFQEVEVDGIDYILVDNRLVCRGGNVYGTLDNGEVTWLTNER